MAQRLATRQPIDVVARQRRQPFARQRPAGAGAVGRENQVWRVPKRMLRRQGLGLGHIDRGPGDEPAPQRFGERVLVHDRAARDIDDDRGFPAKREFARAQQMARVGRQRQHQNDGFDARQDGSERGDGARLVHRRVRRPRPVDADDAGAESAQQPRDFEPGYRGDVTMAEAVALSLNTVAAQVADRVGIENVIATAHALGIVSPLRPDPSLALGTNNVTLLELTSAYAVLANGGAAALPFGVESVEDSSGYVLFRQPGGGREQVADSDDIAQMTRMLEGVIDHGTGRAAAIGRPAAGKTGTTSDFRDALFVGYSGDLVAGVWVGNDDDTPMRHVTGGSLPAEIWRNFMLAALKGAPARALGGSAGSFSSEGGGGRGLEAAWHRTLHFLGLGSL